MNKTPFDVQSEVDMSKIIAHFDQDYVLSVVKESLINRYTPVTMIMPNLVHSIEITFVSNYIDENGVINYPEEITLYRSQLYTSIINFLCDQHNLECIDLSTYDGDVYPLAVVLYDFLISRYKINILNYFTAKILNDIDYIYNAPAFKALIDTKPDILDFGKLYTDKRIGVINSFLTVVINLMESVDVSLEEILSTIINPTERDLILSFIKDKGSFFRDYYIRIMKSSYSYMYLSELKLLIHDASLLNNDNSFYNSLLKNK